MMSAARRKFDPMKMKKSLLACLAVALAASFHVADAGAAVIVQDGKPCAQIVIPAENRPRMTTLAALELRTHIEKMSGVRLPIVTVPSTSGGVKIFVGRSRETDRLGVTAADVKYGAYRMVTGPDWIVLLGHDFDFDPLYYRLPLSRQDMARAADDVYNGDYVALSLATPLHSYYHIEINPDGAVLDGNPNRGWKSLAEVSTERGADFWRVRLRIPVSDTKDFESDPLHRVAGEKPTAENPWYFNVARVRLAGKEREVQAFSPTGGAWHVPLKFGRLEIR